MTYDEFLEKRRAKQDDKGVSPSKNDISQSYDDFRAERALRLNSDEQAAANYFENAAVSLDRFQSEIKNPQPTTYKVYSKSFEQLESDSKRVKNYIESLKGTENYDSMKSAFDSYSSAIASARAQLKSPVADAHIQSYLQNKYNSEKILSDIKQGRTTVANAAKEYGLNESQLQMEYDNTRAKEKQEERDSKYGNMGFDELMGTLKSQDSLGQRIYNEILDEYGVYFKDYGDFDKNRVFQSRGEKYGLTGEQVEEIYDRMHNANDKHYESMALGDTDKEYVVSRILQTGTVEQLEKLQQTLPVAKYYDSLRYQLRQAMEDKKEQRYYLDIAERDPRVTQVMESIAAIDKELTSLANTTGAPTGHKGQFSNIMDAQETRAAYMRELEAKGYNAENMVKFYNRYRERMENEQAQAAVKDWTSQNGFNAAMASVASIPINMLGSLGDLPKVFKARIEELTGGDGWYDPKGTANYTAQNIRSTTTEMIDKETKDSGAWNYWAKQLYSAGMSGGDMALAAAANAIPVVGQAASNAMFFSSAGMNAANEVIENGGNLSQATRALIATGGAELLFERMSLDKLEALATSGNLTSAKDYFKSLTKQAFVEGSEEFNTTLANTFTDALINGGNNSIERNKRSYMAQGMSEKDAENAAMKDWTQEIIDDAVGGALVGGVAGGAAGGYNYVQNTREDASLGKELLDAGDFDLNLLIEQGKQSTSAKAVELAEKLSQKQDRGDIPDAKSVGKLHNILQSESDMNERHLSEKLKGELTADERAIVAKAQNGTVLSEADVQTVNESPRVMEAIARFTNADPEEIKSIDFDEKRGNRENFKPSDSGKTLVDNEEFTGGLEIASVNPRRGLIVYDLHAPDGTSKRTTSDKIRFKSADEALLHERATNYNTEQARAFVENYRDGQNVDNYAREWNLYSNYGRLAVSLNADKMDVGGTLTNAQKIEAYQQGLNARIAHNQVQTIVNTANELKPYTSQNQGTFAYTVPAVVRLTKEQAQMKSFFRDMSVVTGLNVEIFQSQTDANGNYTGENGSFDASTNTLRIDINAGLTHAEQKNVFAYSMLNTAAHELTHVAKQGNKYALLREAVIAALGTTEKDFKTLVEKKCNQLRGNKRYDRLTDKELTELADEEVICDACETMLQGNTGFFENLYKKDKSLAKSFVDAIKNLVEKIKAFVTARKHANTEYGKALLEVADDLYDQIQQLWNEAVESGLETAHTQTAENKKAVAEGGVKEQGRYSYEELIKKPDMAITIIDEKDYKALGLTRSDIVNNAMGNAEKNGYINEKGNAVIHVADIRRDVIITPRSLRHGLDRRINVIGHVTEKIGDILKNSIRLNELLPRESNVNDSYVLIGLAKNKDNVPYVVNIVVNSTTNELSSFDVLYSVNAKKESAVLNEPAGTVEPIRITDSLISISDLLDYVKRNYPDILPESVLRHYGYERRPKGKIGESALYQDRDYSVEPEDYGDLFDDLFTDDGDLSFGEETDTRRAESIIEKMIEYDAENAAYFLSYSAGEIAQNTLNGLKDIELSDSAYLRIAKKFYNNSTVRLNVDSETIAEQVKSFVLLYDDGMFDSFDAFLSEIVKWNDQHMRSDKFASPENMLTNAYTLISYIAEEKAGYAGSAGALSEKYAKMERTSTKAKAEVKRLKAENQELNRSLSGQEDLTDYYRKETYNSRKEIANLQMLNKQLEKARTKAEEQAKKRLERMKSRYDNKLDKIVIAAREKRNNDLRKVRNNYKKDKVIGVMERRLKGLVKALDNSDPNKRVKQAFEETAKAMLEGSRLVFFDNLSAREIVRGDIPDNVTPEERAALKRYHEIIGDTDHKLTDAERIELRRLRAQLKNVLKNERNDYNQKQAEAFETGFIEMLDKLENSYALLKTSGLAYIRDAYDDNIVGEIQEFKAEMRDVKLKDINFEQLEDYNTIIRKITHTISNANKLFTSERSYTETAQAVMREIEGTREQKEIRRKIASGLGKTILWNNFKPVYAVRYIGSETLEKIYWQIQNSELVWIDDITGARDFLWEMKDKYDYKHFDMKFKKKFTAANGTEFELTKDQIFAVYVLSRRGQALQHLLKGGFTFPKGAKAKGGSHTGSTSYPLNAQIINEIIAELSDNERQYAEALQKYLSEVMAKKGNEVSMKLYGVELFNEDSYWSIQSSSDHRQVDTTEQKKEFMRKNAGFTKATVRNASNPIVLNGFEKGWADHVNEMSLYHATTLPIEDFSKVLNYNARAKENETVKNVRTVLNGSFGQAATDYFNTFLQDINGGIQIDSRDTTGDKLISRAKKASVMLNFSVILQQPMAAVRAMNYISPKYFAAPKLPAHSKKWAQLKKYAKIASIKEMGIFDVGMGQGAVEWINTDERAKLLGNGILGFVKAVGSNAKDIVVDSAYRDEVLSRGASYADEVAWLKIWNAVQHETKAKYGYALNSEKNLIKSGERFNEVIHLTQVYDSVLTRSHVMRSKSTFLKMTTAFMAEPTTIVNMAIDAGVQLARKKNARPLLRAGATLVVSMLLNNLLKSIPGAMRDDKDKDDEGNMFIKYRNALTLNLFNDINPANYFPMCRDIVSVIEGYHVDRMDMSLFSNVINSANKVLKEGLTAETGWNLAGRLFDCIGIPLYNVVRDVRSVINTYNHFRLTEEEIDFQKLSLDIESEYQSKYDKYWSKGVEEDKCESKAKSAAKSKMTKELKERYLKALKQQDSDTKYNIRIFMRDSGYYDSLNDVDKALENWRKGQEESEANEKRADERKKLQD